MRAAAKFFVAAFVLIATDIAPAEAQYIPQPCRGVGDGSLDPPLNACVMSFMGVKSMDWHRRSGNAVYRVMLWRHELQTAMFLDFIRTSHGRARVEVRQLTDGRPFYEVALSDSQWYAIQRRWKELPPPDDEERSSPYQLDADGVETVCISLWFASIYVSDGDTLGEREIDSCAKAFALVWYLLAEAAKAAGDCAANARLPEEYEQPGNDERLLACMKGSTRWGAVRDKPRPPRPRQGSPTLVGPDREVPV